MKNARRSGRVSPSNDAETICEAVRRPTMRFVEIKSEDQQAVLAIHRTRDLVVRQRTQVVNMIRSILREFGHVLPTGIEAVSKFAREHVTEERLEIAEIADGILGVMCHQLNGLKRCKTLDVMMRNEVNQKQGHSDECPGLQRSFSR